MYLCYNGEWHGGPLMCGSVCKGGSPTQHSHFPASCRHNLPEERCEALCDDGYFRVGHDIQYECGPDGQWLPLNGGPVTCGNVFEWFVGQDSLAAIVLEIVAFLAAAAPAAPPACEQPPRSRTPLTR